MKSLKKYLFILIALIFLQGCHTSYKSRAKLYRKQAQSCHCKGYSYLFYYPQSPEILKEENKIYSGDMVCK